MHVQQSFERFVHTITQSLIPEYCLDDNFTEVHRFFAGQGLKSTAPAKGVRTWLLVERQRGRLQVVPRRYCRFHQRFISLHGFVERGMFLANPKSVDSFVGIISACALQRLVAGGDSVIKGIAFRNCLQAEISAQHILSRPLCYEIT